MEKICIATRRKRDIELAFSGFRSLDVVSDRQGGTGPACTVTNVTFTSEKESDGDLERDLSGEHQFSLELTPDQTAIQDWLTLLSETKREEAACSIVEETRKIVFNFHFKTVPAVTMLSTADVSRMLSVSPSFLRRLVRSGMMKSYKMGRLRRFSLDDILGYLSETAQTGGSHKERGH